MDSRYLLRSGLAGSDSVEVEVTPESAGWGYSSLKTISLEPAGSHRFETGSDEVIVLPLAGPDMYYLNVMAGPAAERVWKITDHPEQAWVRLTWDSQAIDPRLLPQIDEEA
jgi:5-deoxy-D-glucuronate isomerase